MLSAGYDGWKEITVGNQSQGKRWWWSGRPPPQGRTEVAGSVEGEQGKGVQSKEAAGL